MKKFAALLLALVMLVTLCACGSKDNGKTDDNKTVKVGLILGTGGLGDKNFNDMAYAGMQAAQTELGITFDYLEPETVSDYVPNLRTMCEAGDYDLIVCLGSDMSDALTEVAADFPNQKFSHVDSSLKLDNVSAVATKWQEQTFLTGVLAGLGTISDMPLANEENVIGVILGQENPALRKGCCWLCRCQVM